jgi:hypothetical protein
VRIASLVAAVVLSACGTAAPARAPEVAPGLRLVGCAPAAPLPRTATDLGGPILPGGDDEYGALGYAASVHHDQPPPPTSGASVIAGAPMVSGPLERPVIERMVRVHLPQLRACYERELVGDPGMTGAVTVTFMAGPDGKVTLTNVLGSGVTPAVSACVVRVLQTLSFPAGQMITVTYPFQFTIGGADVAPAQALAPVAGLRPGGPWTPFALGDEPPPRTAPLLARATEGAIRRDIASVAGCFSGAAPLGSLRAMLAVRSDGAIDSARAGGLGDAAEACVARRLTELRVANPVHDAAEIACDFARGEARPWRVAPAAGYTVLEASPRGVRHDDELVTPGVVAPRPLPPDQTFLVVATPETPGAMLELALEWTEQGDATLIALRDGARVPLVVGAARTAHQIGGSEQVTAWPALRVGRTTVTACVDRAAMRVPLGDPVAVDDLLQRMAVRCRGVHCSASLGVSIDAEATVAQLFDVAGAARRAGFQRVLLGSYATCQPAKSAQR